MNSSVLWFRHGLRLHDNPALLAAIDNAKVGGEERVQLFPVFVFDGESASTKLAGYNRMKFLLESLADLDDQLRELGGRLLMFRGQPVEVFEKLWRHFGINKLCFEQDCEPIFQEREKRVELFCRQTSIECVEKISHTLWDPREIIKTNGGVPPLTYQIFLHTVSILGSPVRPVEKPSFENVMFGNITPELATKWKLELFENMPTPEDFGVFNESVASETAQKWVGGERAALKSLAVRLESEEEAFRNGYYLPNQANPDVLSKSTSLSAALRFGCVSVRLFYWKVHDLFNTVKRAMCSKFPEGPHITGQLIWREYFYTMAVENHAFATMQGNPICLNIPWATGDHTMRMVDQWKTGQTGFPLIDAAMRQLLSEGWIHHTLRNIVSTFLTRGGLWLTWEIGVEHFLKYLIDADWAVCAGNWMWVSSSAFETLLDSSKCTCPLSLSQRLDPQGIFIRRYVPELKGFPNAYIHQPWEAPLDVQQAAGCIVGINYPHPMIDFKTASARNRDTMKYIRKSLLANGEAKQHCRPSNDQEIRQFFWLF